MSVKAWLTRRGVKLAGSGTAGGERAASLFAGYRQACGPTKHLRQMFYF